MVFAATQTGQIRASWPNYRAPRHQRAVVLLCTILLLVPATFTVRTPQRADPIPPSPIAAEQTHIFDSYSRLPLAFEENRGQTDPAVRFLSHRHGYSLFLTPTEMMLTLAAAPRGTDVQEPLLPLPAPHQAEKPPLAVTTLRFAFLGAHPNPVMRGEEPLDGSVNYFIGDDPQQWQTNITATAKVRYTDLYDGIDLVAYGDQGNQLEYDAIVAPGADPTQFALSVTGADRVALNPEGDLIIQTASGDVRQRAPLLYQEIGGARRSIEGGYTLHADGTIGFRVEAYDHTAPLVIDPVTLVYGTYLGGNGDDQGYGIAVDSAHNIYITGQASPSFPTTSDSYQPGHGSGQYDVFVVKLNPTGTSRIYATYLGGSGIQYACTVDVGHGIAVDTAGNAYITGDTCGSFPTKNPFQPFFGGGGHDAFVTKLNPNGTDLVYSSYLGGSGTDQGNAIVVDGAGNAYVAGYSYGNFPVTPGAFQSAFSDGAFNGFAAKINAAGSAKIYATYITGATPFGTNATNIAIDAVGNAYIVGSTGSGLPTTPGAYQTTWGGDQDAFVTKLNPSGSSAVYSTYLGGSGSDGASGIAVDNAGNAYIVGTTSGNFPTTPGAYQPNFGGGAHDIFVAKLNPAGSSRVYSTYIGGPAQDSSAGIVIDSAGDAYVTGATFGTFPTTPGAYQTTFTGLDDSAFITGLNPAGTSLVYSTYINGNVDITSYAIAIDSSDNIYITGAVSGTFGATSGAVQPAPGGGGDAYVAKLGVSFTPPDPPPGNTVTTVPGRPSESRTAGAITVYATSFSSPTAPWTATGTVWIGDYTIIDNANVTAIGGSVSGSGLVSLITKADGSERTPLFSDSFTVNTTDGTLTPQAVAGYQFKLNNLVGFRINQTFYHLTLNVTKGNLTGTINLSLVIPGNTIPKTLGFSLDHKGVVRGSLTDVTLFSLGVANLSVERATLGNDGLTITQATLQLPAGLGGAHAALSVGDLHITGSGQLTIGNASATVTLPNIAIGGTHGFGIDGATVSLIIENGTYRFQGAGTFRLPGIVPNGGSCNVGAAFEIASQPPPVRQISLSISGGCVRIPIGTTGFFLTGISGSFMLDEGKTAIDLGIVVTGGPTIPGTGDAVMGTLTAHWDNSWAIGLTGDIKVFTWAGANADLTLSAHSGLIGTLHLTGFNGVFTGDGRMHVWNDNGTALIMGDAMVSVQIPAGALLHQCVLAVCISVPPATIQGPSASAQFGRFRTPDAPDVYGLKGQTTFGTWQPAVFVARDSNVRFDFGGLQQYRLVDQTSGGSAGAQRFSVADAVYPVTVGTATPTLIVALGRDSGTPSLTLTDPTNRVITATTSDPAISYTMTATQTIFTIAHPPTGNWTVTVGNLSGGEHYLLDVVGAPLAAAITQPPTLTATGSGAAPRASSAAYTITTQVSGATGSTYALYYDTDTSGADGTPIATGIPITQTQVNWDTSTVPNGTYYIYAVLDDPTNAPVVAYNATPVTINDSTPPPVPTNLQVSTTGSDALVTWQPSSAPDIAGYHITYQQPNGGQTFVTDVPSGQQGSYTQHGLYLNGTWQIAISAYDLNGNESAPSSTVAAPISAVRTFALAASAGGSATVSPPGTIFAPGSVLTLTATPSSGFVFINWTIDGGDGGSATPLSFTTTGNHSIVANFIPFTVVGTTPTSGSARGGSTVTISGAGFLPGVTVSFGSTSATVVSATETAIVVTTPAHSVGAVDVIITSGGQHASLSLGYTYGDVTALPTAQPTAPPAGGAPAPVPVPRPSVAPPSGVIASPNPLPPRR